MLAEVRRVQGAGTPDGTIAWSPQSDLRNCGVRLIERAIRVYRDGLDAEGRPLPWLAEYLDATGSSIGELADACARFAGAVRIAIDDPGATPELARSRSGYDSCRPELRAAIEAMVGRQALGMTIYACREAAVVGQEPHFRRDLDALVEAGAALAATFAPRPEA